MSFVHLCLSRLANNCCSDFGLFFGALVSFSSVFSIVVVVVLVHLVVLLGLDLALQDLLELVDIVRQKLRHLRHPERRHIAISPHGLHRELLEVKDIVELLFDLVQLDSVLLDFPLFFLFSLLDFLFRPVY